MLTEVFESATFTAEHDKVHSIYFFYFIVIHVPIDIHIKGCEKSGLCRVRKLNDVRSNICKHVSFFPIFIR